MTHEGMVLLTAVALVNGWLLWLYWRDRVKVATADALLRRLRSEGMIVDKVGEDGVERPCLVIPKTCSTCGSDLRSGQAEERSGAR